MRRSGRLRTLPGTVGAALVGTIVLLLLLELGVRGIRPKTGFFLLPSQWNCLQRSSLIDMEFRPNCRGELALTPIRTNSLGLRGAELRQDGVQPILAIGDSCTWGWKVREDESYPAVLQRLLDQHAGQVRYQVLNAGIPGHTSYQGLLYLRERGLSLHPAVVIIGYGFNDASTGGDIEERRTINRVFMPLIRFDDFLINHSSLYHWVRWQTNRPQRTHLPPRVSAEKYARNLTEMITLAQTHGAHVVLLAFQRLVGPYGTALREIAERLDVPLLQYQGPKFDVIHPTPEGYRRLAATIQETLKARGYVE